ncbi:MAG TPA: lysoplasmalogenase [bacterium]|nr:lysoplasmalogenase [bacterium]
MNPSLYPVPVLVITVFFLIVARLRKRRKAVYILKPAATLLVMLILGLSRFSNPVPAFFGGVLLGLVLSLGGDIALMFDSRKAFSAGLVLFLLAHIAYAVTFTRLSPLSEWEGAALLILAMTGVLFYRLIRNRLEKMKGPVIIYMMIISLMVVRAFSTLFSPHFSRLQGGMILSGALLFYVSDMVLAANRFWRPLKYDRVSLAFYYCGQTLIALAAAYF